LRLAKPFLDKWLTGKKIDIILPVPPTKKRDIQPIYIIAEIIANRYRIPYSSEVLNKNATEQAKDMNMNMDKDKDAKDLQGTIQLLKQAKRPCNILLVDDLFSTGSTIAECVRALKSDQLVNNIYVLTSNSFLLVKEYMISTRFPGYIYIFSINELINSLVNSQGCFSFRIFLIVLFCLPVN